MRFTDRKGRSWTLTRTQAMYLAEGRRQELERGWGGMKSTLVVRLLEERGLVTVRWSRQDPTWTITGLTRHGEDILERWNDLRNEVAA